MSIGKGDAGTQTQNQGGGGEGPLGPGSLQKNLHPVARMPVELTLGLLDGGRQILLSLRIRDQFILNKAIKNFWIYYLSSDLVSSDQIRDFNDPNDPLGGSVFAKAVFITSMPFAGPVLTATINSSLVSAGGWLYAVGANVSGEVDYNYTSIPVAIPTQGKNSAVPANEVQNPQVSLANFKVGRTYFDHVNIAYLAPSPLDSFAYVQIFIWNYFNDGQLREGPVFAYNGSPGGLGYGTFVLECDSGLTNDSQQTRNSIGISAVHDVVLFFVALSATHQHRYDFNLPSPTGLANFSGRGGPATGGISPIPSVRIIGGIAPQTTPPIAPYPTGVLLGSKVQLTWTEIDDQNIDHINIYRANQGKFATPVTNAKPAKPFATITKEILSPGVNTWVDADFNDYRSGDVQYSPTNDNTDFSIVNPSLFQYWLTAVNDQSQESTTAETTGILTLRGLEGIDSNPGVTYRDNVFNTYWNTQFNSSTAATALAVTQANQPRTPIVNVAGDSYGYWENKQVGTAVTPTFVTNGTNGTGEVDIPAPTSSTLGNYNRVNNDSPLSVFLPGESVVFSIYAAHTGGPDPIGDPNCAFVFGGVLATGVGTADGTIVAQSDFPGSLLFSTPNYGRFVVYAVIPDASAYTTMRYVVGLRLDTALAGTGTLRIKQPMCNGGTEVANWTATVRDQDAPGGGGGSTGSGTPGGGNPPPNSGSGNQNGSGPPNIRCCMEGTMIETAEGRIPVENLIKGERLVSPHFNEIPTFSRIRKVEPFETDEIWGITAGGKTLWCSRDHPLMVSSRFFGGMRLRRAYKIRPGQFVAVVHGNTRFFRKVETVQVGYGVRARVYMLTLDENPLYIANSFISHNKNYSV